jgi:Tol biopolymer transport system component
MKTPILTAFTLLFCMVTSTSITNSNTCTNDSNRVDDLNKSGLEFYVYASEINTKYSEIPSAVFRNKLITVSSKKIGGLGNGLDKHTNEPFTELFCLDIDEHGSVKNPLFFSRIINTKNNEGQLSFTPDERVVYFTRSSRENSNNYQLYKAELEQNSNGNWINEQELSISNQSYSIENPFVSPDGTELYFSSNMPGTYGGYDLYVTHINDDGTIGSTTNLGPKINTKYDDMYPHLSTDGKKLFFSSKGHDAIGGFDVFVSSISEDLKTPRNLGTEINSVNDEIGFMFINDNKGFFSSNKIGEGSFDIYRFKSNIIYQNLQGIVINSKNELLANTTVVLLDINGNELERQITDVDAYYNFKVKAFENYSIKALKTGFQKFESTFSSYQSDAIIYKETLKLSPKVSLIDNQ